MLNRTHDRDATSEPPQKKLKVADGQENAVPTESTPPGESTQQATNVATPNSGAGGGVHFSGCNIITVNYYADRKWNDELKVELALAFMLGPPLKFLWYCCVDSAYPQGK